MSTKTLEYVTDAVINSKAYTDVLDDKIEERITKVLLKDPSSEAKRLAEDYLIQCIYSATESPDKNPILQRFFSEPLSELREEIKNIRENLAHLNSVTTKLTQDNPGFLVDRVCYLEAKLNKTIEELEKFGITVDY